MSYRRNEIENKLDEFIVQQRAIEFQRMAVQLAKNRWPQIISTEIYKDGGEDGISCFNNGDEKISIACSLTNTLDKIKGDCSRLKEREIIIDRLIFYTPKKVTNITVDPWRIKIKEEFSHDLVVCSREEIVESLIRSENEWICRDYLGLEPLEDSSLKLQSLLTGTTEAVKKLLDGWNQELKFNKEFTVALTCSEKWEKDEDKKPRNYNLIDVKKLLLKNEKIVLFGQPGSGKSTFLYQLARQINEASKDKIPLLVSLPSWANSGKDLFSYLECISLFQAKHISAKDLALVNQNQSFVFLFNGWNEIPEPLLEKFSVFFKDFIRTSSNLGIIISTRESSYSFSIQNSINIQIDPISSKKRNNLIKKIRGNDSGRIIDPIEKDSKLDKITKIPLFLRILTQTLDLGKDLPKTKSGLIEQLVREAEDHDDHQISLKKRTCGFYRKYLEVISEKMTDLGGTFLEEEKTLKVIRTCSENLNKEGKLSEIPEPVSILNLLVDHHLLVRSKIEENRVWFVHQQIQEWFASEHLYNQLKKIIVEDSQELIKRNLKIKINLFNWEEAILFLAEKIGGEQKKSINYEKYQKLGVKLIRLILPICPVFAGKVINCFNEETWKVVKNEMISVFNKIYDLSDEVFKSFALNAMIASGKAEFSPIIWPLIESNDLQVRLKTYRSCEVFNVSVLGENWKNRIISWDIERKRNFILETCLNKGLFGISLALELFEFSDDRDIQIIVMDSLAWNGAFESLEDLIGKLNKQVLDKIIKDGVSQNFPKGIQELLLERLKKSFQTPINDYHQYLILAQKIENRDLESSALIKEYLDSQVLKKEFEIFFDYLEREDPLWLSEFLTKRFLNEEKLDPSWRKYINYKSEVLIKYFIDLITQNNKILDDKYFKVFSPSNSQQLIEILINEILEVRSELAHPGRTTDNERDKYYRLSAVFKNQSPLDVIEVILSKFSNSYSIEETSYIVELLLEIRKFENTLRDKNELDQINGFREVVKSWVGNSIDSGENFFLRANLATLLGMLGTESDFRDFKRLLLAEIKRIKIVEEKRIRSKKEKRNLLSDSDIWQYWDFYKRGLKKFNGAYIENFLLEVLNEPEFEMEAANLLADLVEIKGNREREYLRTIDFEEVFECREHNFDLTHSKKEKKERFSAAIKLKMDSLLKRNKTNEKANGLIQRIIGLGVSLARVEGEKYLDYLLEVVAMDCDTEKSLRILVVLVNKGIILPGKKLESMLGPFVENNLKECRDYKWFKTKICLDILLLSDDVNVGIEQIKKLPSNILSSYRIKEIFYSLGHSNSIDASNYLIELGENKEKIKNYMYEWFESLNNNLTEGVKTEYLNIIDNYEDLAILGIQGYYAEKLIAKGISKVFYDDLKFKDEILKRIREAEGSNQKNILGSILAGLETEEAGVLSCLLINDNSQTPIPGGVYDSIENILVEKIYFDNSKSSYEMKPKVCNSIRKHLFGMVLYDEKRKKSAYQILMWIEKLRKNIGKPSQEPRHPDIETGVSWPPLNFVM